MSKNKKKASNKKAAQEKATNAQVTAAPTKEEPAQAATAPAEKKTAQADAAPVKGKKTAKKKAKKEKAVQSTAAPDKEKTSKTAAEPADEKSVKAAAAEDDKTEGKAALADQTGKTEPAGTERSGNKLVSAIKNFRFKKEKEPKLEKAKKAEKQETGAPINPQEAEKAENKAPEEELEKENQLLNLKKRLLDLNPVFVLIVAAVPLLGAAVSLKNGIMLSCAMLWTVVLLNLLLIPIYRFIPARYRPALSFVAAGVVITPMYAFANYFSPSIASSCGIYLPLIAVAALALCEKRHFGKKYVVPKTALDAFFNGLGFAFAAIVFSVLREVIANGTLYDRPLPYISEAKFNFAAYPAGAFILLAVLAALFRKIFNYKEGKGDDKL